MSVSLYGDEVEMVQPFTVTVLEVVAPGPPDVDDELDTLPPPAWTFTDEPPAELLLESEPVLPVVEDDPAAVMLPSACFSTETLQVSPEEVFPVLMIVSPNADPPMTAISARAVSFIAWAIVLFLAPGS
ncbi:hypothetical protein [Tardiphaga robiniae]|uniref:hypothetical protein n=1 Tax=Tardiphaga TaxID=1395974 RepID=UPI0028650ACA|nr:hypothetical protein [Tardiphaga robiniae]MDR6663306.1 hypothetical protein [Tardiphaga robiniae]